MMLLQNDAQQADDMTAVTDDVMIVHCLSMSCCQFCNGGLL